MSTVVIVKYIIWTCLSLFCFHTVSAVDVRCIFSSQFLPVDLLQCCVHYQEQALCVQWFTSVCLWGKVSHLSLSFTEKCAIHLAVDKVFDCYANYDTSCLTIMTFRSEYEYEIKDWVWVGIFRTGAYAFDYHVSHHFGINSLLLNCSTTGRSEGSENISGLKFETHTCIQSHTRATVLRSVILHLRYVLNILMIKTN